MRIAFGVEYEGTQYHGWQSQEQVTTIQTQLETAFSRVADHPVTVACAGRTDKGVHALGQVAHFDTSAQRSNYAWVFGANTYLANDIRVNWAQPIADEFHARYSAVSRHYRYLIHNHPIHSAIFSRQLTTYAAPLDEMLMQMGAQYLLGEHDFSSYRGIDCQAKSPKRNVQYLTVSRRDNVVIIDIKANAFLHHMVRNIVGVLLEIGIGKRKPEWAQEVLQAHDRTVGGITAPAQGLYLMMVDYPVNYQLPKPPSLNLFTMMKE